MLEKIPENSMHSQETKSMNHQTNQPSVLTQDINVEATLDTLCKDPTLWKKL